MKNLFVLIPLMFFYACVGGGKGESIFSPVIEEETLTVDAGPSLYTSSSIATNSTVSTAPSRVFLWEKLSGPGTITFSSTSVQNPTVSASAEGSYVIKLTVTSGSKVVSDTTAFILDTTNPTVNAGTDNLLANGAFTQNGSASDTNPITFSWTKTSGPGSLVVANNGATPTLSVTSDGSYVIRLTVTDRAGNSAFDEFNLDWDSTSPSVNAGADKTVNASFSQDATTSDAHALTYQWQKVSGPGNITFGSGTSEDTTIAADADGSYVISLTATDTFSNFTTDTITVLWDTTAPVVDGGADINTNQAVTRTLAITDLTATTVVWSKVSGPGTVSFNTVNSKSPSISASAEGTYVIRATVTDALSQVGTDDVTMIWDTTAPVVNAGADIQINVATNINATATDSNSMTYKWTKVSGPGTVVFGSDTNEDTTVAMSSDGAYILRLTVTDGAGNSASDDIQVTWDTTAPTVNAGADKIANALFTQDATVSDTNAVTYQWSKVSGPGNITFGSATSEDTTMTADADGVYSIRLTVTDGAGNSASDDMQLTWDTTAPVVNAGIDHNTNTAISQDATATDLTTMTYSWTKVSGPGNVAFGSATSEDTTITPDSDGVYVIRLTVTDFFGLSTSDDITVEWDTTNPSVNAGVDQLVNALFTQDATVVDANSSLTYQWVKVTGPGSITFGTATTEDTTVFADADGSYIIRLTVTDGAGNTASDEFSLTWDASPPVVDAGTDKTVLAQVNQNATVTDATAITYSWTKQAGPGVVTFGTASAEDTSLQASLDGVYTIRLTATDAAGNSAFDEMTFTWDTTNPVVNAGIDQETNVLVNQDATTTDLTAMTYLWNKVSGPGAVSFGSGTSEDTSISANADGVYVIRLTVTDAVGLSTSDDINFTWDTSNPIVNAGVDKIANALFTQDATVTDATTLTYQWSKVSGPGTITFGSATSEDTTVTASADGVYVIQLQATDVVGNVATDTFQLTWDATPPTVNAGADSSRNGIYTQDATVTDATSVTYAWTKQSGPGLVIFGSDNAEDTTVSPSADGVYVLRLTVTDAAGNSNFDEVTLTWDTTPPAVNAGVDVETNVAASQDATVTDSTAITYSWTKSSGPGTLTFGTPAAEDTTISASSDGVYVVKLTATDALGNSASDTINFTWDTTAPVVSVGNDIIASGMFSLDASSSDLTAMTYSWTGPGAISFGTPATEDTTISASADGSYLITLTVTDAVGNSSNDSFTLTWDATAPVVNAGVDKNTNAMFTQDATITEANISTIQWSKVSGPGTISFGSATSEDTTVFASADGTYVIRLTVTDIAGNASNDEFTLVWDNTAPTVNAGVDKIANASFTQDATATDAGAMTYQWTKVSGPGVITFGSATSEDTTMSASVDGVYVIQLQVTDAIGNSASDTMQLTWDTAAPSVNAGADKVAGATFSQDATTSDATAMTYLWSKQSGPGNIVFGSGTSEDTSVTPDTDGSYVVRLTVTDAAGNSAFDEFSLTWDGTAPVVNAGVDKVANASFTQDATITETNISTIQWSKVSGPGTITFGTPNAEDTTIFASTDGAYVIRLTVTDTAGHSTSDDMNLTWDNTSPVVNAGADVIANAASLQNATVTDASSLTYQWSKVSGPGNISFGTGTSEDTTISADTDGAYVIRLQATDAVGNIGSDTINFTWDATTPVVNVGSDIALNAQGSINATVTEANVSTYAWTQTSGPGTVTFGSPSSEDTTVSANTDGVYVVRLTVTDIAGNSSFDELTLTWDTTAPVIAAIPTINGSGVTPELIDATVTDSTALTYSWSQTSGPGVITFDFTNLEDTNVTADTDGAYTILYQVTDALGNTNSRSVTLNWTGAPLMMMAFSMSAESFSGPESSKVVLSVEGEGNVRIERSLAANPKSCGAGEVVYSGKIDGETQFIDVTPFAFGEYIYKGCASDGGELDQAKASSSFFHEYLALSKNLCEDKGEGWIYFKESNFSKMEIYSTVINSAREVVAFDKEDFISYLGATGISEICLSKLDLPIVTFSNGKLSFDSIEKAQALIEKVHFYDESGVIYSLDREEFKAEVLIPVANESSFYLSYRF